MIGPGGAARISLAILEVAARIEQDAQVGFGLFGLAELQLQESAVVAGRGVCGGLRVRIRSYRLKAAPRRPIRRPGKPGSAGLPR